MDNARNLWRYWIFHISYYISIRLHRSSILKTNCRYELFIQFSSSQKNIRKVESPLILSRPFEAHRVFPVNFTGAPLTLPRQPILLVDLTAGPDTLLTFPLILPRLLFLFTETSFLLFSRYPSSFSLSSYLSLLPWPVNGSYRHVPFTLPAGSEAARLTDLEHNVIQQLLSFSQSYIINDITVVITEAQSTSFINISPIISDLLNRHETAKVLFALFSYEDKIFIVGRSKVRNASDWNLYSFLRYRVILMWQRFVSASEVVVIETRLLRQLAI